jgi:hypothetical protein
MPKARIILAYGWYQVGDIIEPSGLLFDYLRAYGFVEPYEEPVEAAQEPAQVEPELSEPAIEEKPKKTRKVK